MLVFKVTSCGGYISFKWEQETASHPMVHTKPFLGGKEIKDFSRIKIVPSSIKSSRPFHFGPSYRSSVFACLFPQRNTSRSSDEANESLFYVLF